MRARFDKEQPNVSVTYQDGKVYIFICQNGDWNLDLETSETYWECDYKQIVTTSDKIDVSDVQANPSKYMNWTEPKEKTEAERITELESANDMLTQCILELSSIVYE